MSVSKHKVRAWDHKRNRMTHSGGGLRWGSFDVNGDWYELDIELSTGLTDANGVEIFEGDVVTGEWTSGEPNVIAWDGAGFVRRFADGDRYHNIQHCRMTVVGNIHQNKELLTEGKQNGSTTNQTADHRTAAEPDARGPQDPQGDQPAEEAPRIPKRGSGDPYGDHADGRERGRVMATTERLTDRWHARQPDPEFGYWWIDAVGDKYGAGSVAVCYGDGSAEIARLIVDQHNAAIDAKCATCEGAGMRPPDDCFAGKINDGASELQNMVYDCNNCPHAQPCMVPCPDCAAIDAGAAK